MKVLTILALALATATAFDLTKGKLKSRNILVPAGHPEGRIIKGHTALNGEFPYQVGLILKSFSGNSSGCGGSLLSNTKVLTAAHCTVDIEKGRAFLGSNLWVTADVERNFTGQDILIHPGWINDTVFLNDISIITIPYTQYTNKIQPVKLPATRTFYSSYIGREVRIPGWGKNSDSSEHPVLNLEYANKTVVPNNVCVSFYNIPVSSTNICIATSDGTSPCEGDSGGPMVLTSTGVQIGLFSFFPETGCEASGPAVYTRVTKYLDWIKRNAGV